MRVVVECTLMAGHPVLTNQITLVSFFDETTFSKAHIPSHCIQRKYKNMEGNHQGLLSLSLDQRLYSQINSDDLNLLRQMARLECYNGSSASWMPGEVSNKHSSSHSNPIAMARWTVPLGAGVSSQSTKHQLLSSYTDNQSLRTQTLIRQIFLLQIHYADLIELGVSSNSNTINSQANKNIHAITIDDDADDDYVSRTSIEKSSLPIQSFGGQAKLPTRPAVPTNAYPVVNALAARIDSCLVGCSQDSQVYLLIAGKDSWLREQRRNSQRNFRLHVQQAQTTGTKTTATNLTQNNHNRPMESNHCTTDHDGLYWQLVDLQFSHGHRMQIVYEENWSLSMLLLAISKALTQATQTQSADKASTVRIPSVDQTNYQASKTGVKETVLQAPNISSSVFTGIKRLCKADSHSQDAVWRVLLERIPGVQAWHVDALTNRFPKYLDFCHEALVRGTVAMTAMVKEIVVQKTGKRIGPAMAKRLVTCLMGTDATQLVD